MGIEIEIERAVKRTVALDKDSPTKSDSEQEKIISDVKSALDNSTFNFENTTSLMLNQNEKKRLVKQYIWNAIMAGVQRLYKKARSRSWKTPAL